MEPIIEVRNLSKVFKSRGRKITAVDDVSFDVSNGEIFSMIGPNGAGKSTTFAMMTTLIKPTCGKIKVAGFDAENEDDRIRPIIGIVPQKLSLYPDLTARENLELMGNLYDVPKKVMEERIEYYLKLVNLETHADRLTGGFYPLSSVPDWMRWIAYVVPLTYANDAMRTIMVKGQGLAFIANDLIILLFFAIFYFGLGVYLFRREAA